MTTMYIDNKANVNPTVENYIVDRSEYSTIQDLYTLANDCMNDNVYLIRMSEDGKELFTVRNH